MRRKVLKPSYYPSFECIGGACEDTCCAGWYIAIDEATYKKYKKVKDPIMKKRLDKELVAKKGVISKEHVAKIKLKNNSCAFLNTDGLCDIYSQLGEHYLSQTCQLYPRTINEVGNILEHSLALSCPEAGRKVLLREEGIDFLEEEQEVGSIVISGQIKMENQKPKVWQDYLKEMRAVLIAILQNRHLNFEQRWQVLEETLQNLHTLSKPTSFKKIPDFIHKTNKDIQNQKPIHKTNATHELKFNQYKLLLEKLKDLRAEKKWPSTRYETCYDKMLQGLEDNFKEAAFKEGYETYYLPFMKEYDYLLENYFVNYIYERVVPLDGSTILESLTYLKLYKYLIELHLVGIANVNKGLDWETVLTFIQAFTKVFDHNERYRAELIKELEPKQGKENKAWKQSVKKH